MRYLTKQQLFDKAVRHLFSQTKAGLMQGGGGAYRGHGGGCCPIGNLIADDDYTTRMEGVPIRYIGRENKIGIPSYMDPGIAALERALRNANVNIDEDGMPDFLSKLQNVHDIFGTWEWKERFNSIAKEYGLDASSVNLQ
jgi:hypothetical protein